MDVWVRHVWMWELDHKGDWTLNNWCFLIVVLEKTLESPLDCKEIKPVNPKVNQPWIVIAKTDAEAEAPVRWPPDVKSRLIGKDPDTGEDWSRRRRGIQWMRWFNDITESTDRSLTKFQVIVKDREDWRAAIVGWQRPEHDCNWTAAVLSSQLLCVSQSTHFMYFLACLLYLFLVILHLVKFLC